MGNPIQAAFQAALFGLSVVYQHRQKKKARDKAAAERDKSLGLSVTVGGDPAALPVVYGRNKLGGIRTYHDVRNTLNGNVTTTPDKFFYRNNNATGGSGLSGVTAPQINGNKNEFLILQQALCLDGIQDVPHVEVNRLNWNDEALNHGQWINVYYDGDRSDLWQTSNGVPSTNRFLNTASLRMAFRLDRENYNYSGIPEVTSYVYGKKVHMITHSGGNNYALTATKTYTNNPAYCLLDYLMSPLYGRGLSLSQIDLKSFYDAAQLCNVNVLSNVNAEGHIYGGPITRNVLRYECNIILSTEDPIRENISKILETMGQADLIWSEGKYKLNLIYPTTPAQQLALVNPRHFFSDDDISNDSISISFPTAEERFNQFVIRFRNEHKNFEEDTATWPLTNDGVFNTYLAEDGGVLNKGESFAPGVVDPYHAMALAEQNVRSSRLNFTARIVFVRNSRAMSLEPGDLFAINSPNAGLINEIFRVTAVRLNDDFTIEVECYRFDYTVLAWNVADNVAYLNRPVYDFSISPVATGFLVTPSGFINSDGSYIPSIRVSWTTVGDSAVTTYELQWKAQVENQYKSVILAGTAFEIYPVVPGITYDIRVRSRSPTRTSSWLVTTATAPNDLTAPGLPSNFLITNGIKSVNLKWTNPTDRDLAATEIWRNTINNVFTATRIATVRSTHYTDQPLNPGGVFHYWIRSLDTSLNTSAYVYGGTGTSQAVGTNDLGPNVVTADKVAAGSITAQNGAIADLSVQTIKIAGNAITFNRYFERNETVTWQNFDWFDYQTSWFFGAPFEGDPSGRVVCFWQTSRSTASILDSNGFVIGAHWFELRLLINGVQVAFKGQSDTSFRMLDFIAGANNSWQVQARYQRDTPTLGSPPFQNPGVLRSQLAFISAKR
jgi:hypothetical protein